MHSTSEYRSIFPEDYREQLERKAPEWANYAAMDTDGLWYYYENAPYLGYGSTIWLPTTGQITCNTSKIGPDNLERMDDSWCLEITPDVNNKGSATDTQVGGDHYKNFKIQPVKFIQENNLTFLEGCVIKRVCRHSRGGKGSEDIQKAIHELQLILELQYGVKNGAN